MLGTIPNPALPNSQSEVSRGGSGLKGQQETALPDHAPLVEVFLDLGFRLRHCLAGVACRRVLLEIMPPGELQHEQKDLPVVLGLRLNNDTEGRARGVCPVFLKPSNMGPDQVVKC